MNRLFPMKNRNRLKAQTQYIERIAVQFMNLYLRNGGTWIVFVENVLEDPADRLQHGCKSVNGDVRPLVVIEGPDIVEAKDMVSMVMRINDCVQRRRFCPQHLCAKVGRGVHDNVSGSGGNQDRRPQPFVTGVGGEANRAGTTNGWYAGTGPGAKHR